MWPQNRTPLSSANSSVSSCWRESAEPAETSSASWNHGEQLDEVNNRAVARLGTVVTLMLRGRKLPCRALSEDRNQAGVVVSLRCPPALKQCRLPWSGTRTSASMSVTDHSVAESYIIAIFEADSFGFHRATAAEPREVGLALCGRYGGLLQSTIIYRQT